MNFRKLIFSFFNKKVFKEVEAIRYLIKKAPNVSVCDYQKLRLRTLLAHAIAHSEFYHNLTNDLSSFPVINKNDIKDNYNSFLTMPISGLRSMTTSGSTGTPFTIYQNKEKVLRSKADLLYMYSEGGYEFGLPMCYLRSMYGVHKNKIKLKLLNLKMIDISNLNNTKLEHIVNYLKTPRKNKQTVLSYASSLTSLANYIVDNNINETYSVKCMFSGAEALPLRTKEILAKYLDCPIISRYSNQEMGLLAQQTIYSDSYELNTASYYFEFLKLDSDQAAEAGEKARIIVTDLFNFAFPLIRYDTGDIGVFEEIGGKKRLEKIEGRKVDFIFTTSGELLSPHSITNSMWNFTDIKQFQFIQESRNKYTILLNTAVEIDSNIMTKHFKNLLGKDALITIEYVEEIPVLDSGKRKYIINKTI